MHRRIQHSSSFGFIKTLVDAHTMGLFTMANLLRECGYHVCIADNDVCEAIESINKLNCYSLVKKWLVDNNINRVCFSYRLDPKDGCAYFMSLYSQLKSDMMLSVDGGPVCEMSFAGLPEACKLIEGRITDVHLVLFPGGETPHESLKKYSVPDEIILDSSILCHHPYDKMLLEFSHRLVSSERYKHESYLDHYGYPECGKNNDTYLARLNYAFSNHTLPLIRTHSGPFNQNRIDALKEYNSWCRELAGTKLLDILSIGTSQLTQSAFGEDWQDRSNGGGLPVQNEVEYRVIKDNSLPMLVRTYAGTKNVPTLAAIHERSLNICWHALSFWWFDELDGRGPNSLLDNLKEHFEAVKYIASTGKPVEPNVPHHFAFRGCDDISYIISGFLASKACKLLGVRHLVLQIMLNTPKYTWGVQDLAKARALLKLVRELEDQSFSISLQARAGLDVFVADLIFAKEQLAAITCMMDDIEPGNDDSPEIIHVVNYCEAVRLATPPVIKESIQITLNALHEYRAARKAGKVPDMRFDMDVNLRFEALYQEARNAIDILESKMPNLYSPIGFYKVFCEGFIPVPYLWDQTHKFSKATQYQTAIKNGGVYVVDNEGRIVNTSDRYRAIFDQIG